MSGIRIRRRRRGFHTAKPPLLADSGSGHSSGTGLARARLAALLCPPSCCSSGGMDRVRGRLKSRWEMGGSFSSVMIIVGLLRFSTELERGCLKTVRMSMAVSTESGVGGVGSGLLIFAVSAGHYLRSLVNKERPHGGVACEASKTKNNSTYAQLTHIYKKGRNNLPIFCHARP